MKTEFKHTEGEWHAKEGQIYSLETGKTLALIPYFDNEEEQIANSKLMANSPELLEISLALWMALQKEVKNIPTYRKQVLTDFLGYAERTIKKAIE